MKYKIMKKPPDYEFNGVQFHMIHVGRLSTARSFSLLDRFYGHYAVSLLHPDDLLILTNADSNKKEVILELDSNRDIIFAEKIKDLIIFKEEDDYDCF